MPTKRAPLIRFLEKIRLTETGCWEWLGWIRDGYGLVRVDDRDVQAHVFAYETFIGPIPEGYEIDHVCRNRACVRPHPSHLEAVTHSENVLRALACDPRAKSKRTHCVRGHEFTPENTIIQYQPSSGRAYRRCRICVLERQRNVRRR